MKFTKTPAILRWPGAKWRIASWIVSHIPDDHFTYCEPFGGSAAVLLSKSESRAEVYNDVDRNLVNFFRVIRNDREGLVRQLRYTPYSRSEYVDCWKKLATQRYDTELEWARCFAVTVFQARSSMFRANAPTGWRIWAKESTFSQTPGDQWAQYAERIEAVADRLRRVQMECRPALEVIKGQDSRSTLFYVDPPYLGETRQTKEHYENEMADQAHETLLSVLRGIQGQVLLSGYDSDMYRDLLCGWKVVSRSSHADTGSKREEMLWLNPQAEAALIRQTNPNQTLFSKDEVAA